MKKGIIFKVCLSILNKNFFSGSVKFSLGFLREYKQTKRILLLSGLKRNCYYWIILTTTTKTTIFTKLLIELSEKSSSFVCLFVCLVQFFFVDDIFESKFWILKNHSWFSKHFRYWFSFWMTISTLTIFMVRLG